MHRLDLLGFLWSILSRGILIGLPPFGLWSFRGDEFLEGGVNG